MGNDKEANRITTSQSESSVAARSIDAKPRANPQAEDGHIDIANEIAEALMKVNLSAYESRILG